MYLKTSEARFKELMREMQVEEKIREFLKKEEPQRAIIKIHKSYLKMINEKENKMLENEKKNQFSNQEVFFEIIFKSFVQASTSYLEYVTDIFDEKELKKEIAMFLKRISDQDMVWMKTLKNVLDMEFMILLKCSRN